MKRLIVLLMLLTLPFLVTSACAMFTPPGGMSTSDTLEWMKLQNARGCMYARGASTAFLTASFGVVGTWGADPPPYAECFQGLPMMGVSPLQAPALYDRLQAPYQTVAPTISSTESVTTTTVKPSK
jgi:hypothetical protein